MVEKRGKYTDALWQYYHQGRIPVIPDIKLQSPGEGDLLLGRDPIELTKALAKGGAPAFSVVTEREHFGGSLDLLADIAQGVSVPVLRKDFITTKGQLRETKEAGAHAVLLIAAMLSTADLLGLFNEALELGLEPLIETHRPEEIRQAIQLDLTFLGINNRNIIELELDDGDVSNTEKLASLVPADVFLLSESAIMTPQDVGRAIHGGAHGVLVGTAILQAKDPVDMLHRLSITRGSGFDQG